MHFVQAKDAVREKKRICLYSGGKDSFYSLLEAIRAERQPVYLLVATDISDASLQGDLGLTAINAVVLEQQLAFLGLPVQRIIYDGSQGNAALVELLRKHIVAEGIESIITGDLWHTEGIGRLLKSALPQLEVVADSHFACPTPAAGLSYLQLLARAGIRSKIWALNPQLLSETYLGRTIDITVGNELLALGIDLSGENGEYQSVVVDAPLFAVPVNLPVQGQRYVLKDGLPIFSALV